MTNSNWLRGIDFGEHRHRGRAIASRMAARSTTQGTPEVLEG